MLKLRNLVIGGAVAALLSLSAITVDRNQNSIRNSLGEDKKPVSTSIENTLGEDKKDWYKYALLYENKRAWGEAHKETQEFIRRNPESADALDKGFVTELDIESSKRSPNYQPEIQVEYKTYNFSGLLDFIIVNATLSEGLPRVGALIKPHHDIIDPFNIVSLEKRAREKAKVLLQDPVYLNGLVEAYKFEKFDCKAVSTTFAMAILSEAANIKGRTNSVSLELITGLHFDSTRTNPPAGHAWVRFNGMFLDTLTINNYLDYVPVAATTITFDTNNQIKRTNPRIETYPAEYVRVIKKLENIDKVIEIIKKENKNEIKLK